MAKDTLFRVYDLRSKKAHTIPAPPTKIAQPRLERAAWIESQKKHDEVLAGKISKKKSKAKRPQKKKVPATASDVLRYNSFEFVCLRCGKDAEDPAASAATV